MLYLRTWLPSFLNAPHVPYLRTLLPSCLTAFNFHVLYLRTWLPSFLTAPQLSRAVPPYLTPLLSCCASRLCWGTFVVAAARQCSPRSSKLHTKIYPLLHQKEHKLICKSFVFIGLVFIMFCICICFHRSRLYLYLFRFHRSRFDNSMTTTPVMVHRSKVAGCAGSSLAQNLALLHKILRSLLWHCLTSPFRFTRSFRVIALRALSALQPVHIKRGSSHSSFIVLRIVVPCL